jgi:transketolase
MSRDELEEFARNTLVALRELEIENDKLKLNLDTAAHVDIEVINAWQKSAVKAEKERNKWSKLATKMSEENQQLKKMNEKLMLTSEKILTTLDSIAKTAHDNANPKLKALKLSRVMTRIKDVANEAKSEILEFFAEEPDEQS